MKIYYSLEKQTEPTAVALGYFDGLHVAHRRVVSKAIEFKNHSFSPAVFTFLKNSKDIVSGVQRMQIMSLDEKEKALETLGVEVFYAVDFLGLRTLSAENFVKDVLVDVLNAKVLVCGFNYHFGYRGIANANDLKSLGDKYGIEVEVVEPVMYKDQPISSTRIRKALQAHDFKTADDMFGAY